MVSDVANLFLVFCNLRDFYSINDVVIIRTRMTKKQYQTKITTTSLFELGKGDVIELMSVSTLPDALSFMETLQEQNPDRYDGEETRMTRSHKGCVRPRLQHKGGTLHVSKYVKTRCTFDLRECK